MSNASLTTKARRISSKSDIPVAKTLAASIAAKAIAATNNGLPSLSVADAHTQWARLPWKGRLVNITPSKNTTDSLRGTYNCGAVSSVRIATIRPLSLHALYTAEQGWHITGVTLDGRDVSMVYLGDTIISQAFEEDPPVPPEVELDQKGMILRNSITKNFVGSDPEMFVTDGNGKLIPAFLFLGPQQKDDLTPFYDGYQCEFSTTPATCLESHIYNIRRGMKKLLTLARKYDPDAELSIKSVVDVSQEELQSVDPMYSAFGCTPSESAYGESRLDVDPVLVPFRMSGGHLHFSVSYNQAGIIEAVKKLDAVLGVICVSLFQKYDDARRRSLYGKAGEFRFTPYGFEYRVLSNAWLVHPVMKMFVYEVARSVLGRTDASNKKGPSGSGLAGWDASEAEVRECINTCNVALAHQLLERNAEPLNVLLRSLPGVSPVGVQGSDSWPSVRANMDALRQMIFSGVHTVLKTPDEIAAAWALDKSEDDGSWYGDSPTSLRRAIPVLASGKKI